MSLSPNQNPLDRLLRLSPWLAGALVAICFLALAMRLLLNAGPSDRAVIAAGSIQRGAAEVETPVSEREVSPAMDLSIRSTEHSTAVDVPRPERAATGEVRPTERDQWGEALGVVQRPQTPGSRSRLTVHGSRGESSPRESTANSGGQMASSRPLHPASASNTSSTQSPVIRSTASRLISGAPSSSGRGHTSFFGIEALGRRFAYVLDRSGSMGDPDNKPLAAAKQELLASLERLEGTHQFFLIFYNDDPAVFNPVGAGRQLVFADELNKQQARRFVQSIQARGGTRHYEALQKAIALRPDVIFLLTDGEPKDDLAAEELVRLTRSNEGIAQIHVVQFANAPYDGNSLVRLARENRGQHTYKALREIVSQREF